MSGRRRSSRRLSQRKRQKVQEEEAAPGAGVEEAEAVPAIPEEEEEEEEHEDDGAQEEEEEEEEEEVRQAPRVLATPSRSRHPASHISLEGTPSSLRVAREQERENLAVLNHRLTHYVLKQRERDSRLTETTTTTTTTLSTTETEAERRSSSSSKAAVAEEVRALRAELEATIRSVREQRNVQQKDILHLEKENAQLRRLVKTLRQQLVTVEQPSPEILSASALRQPSSSSSSSSPGEPCDPSDCEERLAIMRLELKRVQLELARSRLREEDAEKSLQLMVRKHAAEEQVYTRMLQELEVQNQQTTEDLREQLFQAIQAHQAEIQVTQKQSFAELQQTYRNRLSKTRHAYHELRERTDALEREVLELRTKAELYDALMAESTSGRSSSGRKKSRKKEAADTPVSEAALRAAQAEWEKLLTRHETELEDQQEAQTLLRLELQRREEEFETLLEVKIGLRQELDEYRRLLQMEERRLGIRVTPEQQQHIGIKRSRSELEDFESEDEGDEGEEDDEGDVEDDFEEEEEEEEAVSDDQSEEDDEEDGVKMAEARRAEMDAALLAAGIGGLDEEEEDPEVLEAQLRKSLGTEDDEEEESEEEEVEEEMIVEESESDEEEEEDVEMTKAVPDDDHEDEEEDEDELEAVDESKTPLIISSLDLVGEYLLVKNRSRRQMNLGGWTLSSHRTKAEFELPSLDLGPGDVITVWTGLQGTPKGSRQAAPELPEGEFRWPQTQGEDGGVFDLVSGDVALLSDPDGELMSKVEIVRTT